MEVYLSLTTINYFMKGNALERTGTRVYLGKSNLIVNLTSLFNAVTVLDRRDLRCLIVPGLIHS